MFEKFSGTVSAGTMRSQDLIPRFIGTLSELLEEHTFAPGADAPDSVARQGRMQDRLGEIERRAKVAGYHDREESDDDLEWLFEALDEWAPAGFTFGAHPGDGADYGFWPMEIDHYDATEE